jgi:hypothetical protein
MTKVALLFSGLPRCLERGFENIHNSLIKPNNPDIFIHTWGDPGDPRLRSSITNLYKPNMLVIEPPKIIHNTHINLDRMMASHGRSYKRDKFVEMTYSMWYSMLQANLLKEHNRLEHNIYYDYVIRARFDINYTKAVNVEQYDRNIIHTADRPDLPPEMVDDRFGFASNELMNIYCGGFNLIETIFSKRDKLDGIFCGETICYEMFKLFDIKHTCIPGLAAIHLNHG